MLHTWAASLDAVFVQIAILSCALLTLTTAPQISSLSSNCSPIMASNCIYTVQLIRCKISKKQGMAAKPPEQTNSTIKASCKSRCALRTRRFQNKEAWIGKEDLQCAASKYQEQPSHHHFWEVEQSTCHHGHTLGPPTWAQFQPWSSGNQHLQSTC